MDEIFQTADPKPGNPGPSGRRPRRDSTALGRTVALRSAALSVLLLGGATLARHSEDLLARFSASRTDALEAGSADSPDALVARVEEAATAADAAEVARLCAALCARFPDHPVAEPAHLRLVQARLQCGDLEGAQEAFRAFRTRHPESRLLPEALLDLAGSLYEVGSYAAAAQTYTDLVGFATSATPEAHGEDTAPEPVIWRSLTAWRAHRRAERSRTELERLARFNQALAYEHAGDRDAALRAFDRFLSRFPQDGRVPEARLRVAGMLLEQGRVEEALAELRAVHGDSSAPANLRSECAYRAGRVCEMLRRFDEAVAAYAEVVPLRPSDGEYRLAALAQLAQIVQEREPLRALALYRDLASHSPQAPVRAAALERLAALERDSALTASSH